MATAVLTAEDVLESLTRVVDPVVGITIVDMGFVYGIEVAPGAATIQMTLTTPDSPAREEIVAQIHEVLRRRHPGLDEIVVDLVWEPAWSPDFITEDGRRQMLAPITRRDPASGLTADDVRESLMLVMDPEVGINIVDLGLVYGVELEGTAVRVVMTLTTPGCPLHASIEAAVRRVVETRHPAVTDVAVELVWDPPWDTDRITAAGRHALGW